MNEGMITRMEHAESISAIAAEYRRVEREVERLRALLREIAASGVIPSEVAVEASISRDTWHLELQHSPFTV